MLKKGGGEFSTTHGHSISMLLTVVSSSKVPLFNFIMSCVDNFYKLVQGIDTGRLLESRHIIS